MAKTYKYLSDLTKEVKSCIFIDLIPHVSGIDPLLLEALQPAAYGLYLPGAIEPLFNKVEQYTIIHKENVGIPTVETPITVEDVQADILGSKRLPPGQFWSDQNRLFLKRSSYERIKKYLRPEPQVSLKGCDAAIATVVSYLNGLCPEHNHVPVRHYDLFNLVKPEFRHLLETETFEQAFDDLFLEVSRFVGFDEWSTYHYRIVGTTLIIEKGLDFRIIDWHTKQIKSAEGYDHDFGGVTENYEEQNTSH